MASDGDEGEGGRIVKAQPSIMSRGSRQEVNGKRTALFEERGDQREPLEGHEEESGKKVTAGEKCRRCKVASVTGFMGREGRRGRRRTSPLSLNVDVKHITFNSQSPDLSLYRQTWFSGSWMWKIWRVNRRSGNRWLEFILNGICQNGAFWRMLLTAKSAVSHENLSVRFYPEPSQLKQSSTNYTYKKKINSHWLRGKFIKPMLASLHLLPSGVREGNIIRSESCCNWLWVKSSVILTVVFFVFLLLSQRQCWFLF